MRPDPSDDQPSTALHDVALLDAGSGAIRPDPRLDQDFLDVTGWDGSTALPSLAEQRQIAAECDAKLREPPSTLDKDCGCRDEIHTGPHHLHADRLWHEANQKLLAAGNVQGFLVEDSARLAEKKYQMEHGLHRLERLVSYTPDQVESLYRQGAIGRNLYEDFRQLWRLSVFRWSDLWADTERVPIRPAVARVLATQGREPVYSAE